MAQISPGGRKLARSKPTECKYCSHWQSETSVFRPGTFFTCCALTRQTSSPRASRIWYTGIQYTLVDSIATERIPHCSSQSARTWRSRVNVGKLRTGCGSRSAATATYNSLAPTSMPAASGCNTGKVSHLLLLFLAICSSVEAARMPGARKQSKLPIEIVAGNQQASSHVCTQPQTHAFRPGFTPSTNVGAGCSCHPRASAISSLDSRSFTSCLARASCTLLGSNLCLADDFEFSQVSKSRPGTPYHGAKDSASGPGPPVFNRKVQLKAFDPVNVL